MKSPVLSKFLFLTAVMLALASVGCQAVQPTKNPDGSQTASPAGRQVLAAADAVAPPAETLLSTALPWGLGSVAAAAIAWGVKRLHDKLDDITPETPSFATPPKPPGT